MEPEVRCVAGFLSPSTGIIDSHGLMLAYLGDAESRGAALALGSPVVSGRATKRRHRARGRRRGADDARMRHRGEQRGLQRTGRGALDRRHPAATIPPTHYAIGHYYTLSGAAPFRRLVYPVARQDWLGVHVTIDLGGQVKFGPDFSWIDRVDYRFDESREAAFYQAIRRYYPGLKDGTLQPGYTGIRPKIHGPGRARAGLR